MKKRTWLILAAIVLACVGIKLWYDHLCYGEIDISDSAPSKAMLLHIIEHVDELAAREDLFTRGTYGPGFPVIYFTGNPEVESSFLWLNDGQDLCETYGHYYRWRDPSFFYIPTPWSELQLSFYACAPGIMLVITDYGAPAVSDAPLREMMSAIESVIGTP